MADGRSGDEMILEIEDLTIDYGGRGRRSGQPAVDGVSISVRRGETVGLVGESGSGKSSIGLAAVGLLSPAGGSVALEGRPIGSLRGAALRRARDRASMIFQSSSASLDPRRTVGWSIAEPLLARGVAAADRERKLQELLSDVNLSTAMAGRYPHELSGGQKQRVGIARALASDPVLLVCDEPTSALDVSVQAQIVNTLQRLQAERGLALLFITHDLAVVEAMSHRIVVLRSGRIVEQGDAAQVLRDPQQDYTRRLLAAVPGQGQRRQLDNRLALRAGRNDMEVEHDEVR